MAKQDTPKTQKKTEISMTTRELTDNIKEMEKSYIDRHTWLKFFSAVITTAIMLFLLYIAIRYPISYFWHTSKILMILFIPIYYLVLVIVGFGLACFIFYSILLALIITAETILLSKNLSLYILALITKSHCLYSRIKPSWVPSLLLKMPTAQAVEILEKMKTEHVYHILHNKKGLSLLLKMSINDSVKILKKMDGVQVYQVLHNKEGLSLLMNMPIGESVKILKKMSIKERSCILLSEDLQSEQEYPSFLRSIPSRIIEECQYSIPIEKRRRFADYMYNVGIKINVKE